MSAPVAHEGISFKPTEEQEMIVRSVEEFATREIKPHVRFIDDNAYTEEGIKKLFELRKKAAEQGILRLGIPPEYGGEEVSAITIGMVVGALARQIGSYTMISPVGAKGLPYLVANYGTEEQKKTILPQIARGELDVGIATTEPDCGSDAAAIKTRAVKDGDDYVITGEKTFISHVMYGNMLLVFCKTNPEQKHRGVSSILVEMDRPGIRRSPIRTMGRRHEGFGSVWFDQVRVPASNLVGEEGMGFIYAKKTFDRMRAINSLGYLGIAEGALQESIEYVRHRHAFGRPLGKFEAINFRIAEDYTTLEAARLLCLKTLWMMDQKMDIAKEAAMVKSWVPVVAFNTVNNCLQNKGALGYTLDSMDEYRLREVRSAWIGDGPIEIMKMVVGREILGKECNPL